MKRLVGDAMLLIGVACVLAILGGNAGAVGVDYLSPLALALDKDGKTLYVAEVTAKQVAVLDLSAGKVSKTIRLPDHPGGLALSPDGASLYVTGASPRGRVHVIDLEEGRITSHIPVGHTPVAPVVSRDGKTLYVCNRFNNNISVINLASRKEVARIAVMREPVAAAVTLNGKYLFVANHLPAGPADGDYVAAAVSVIDTRAREVVATIRLHNGSIGLRDICISPDGQHAYVTHILARYPLPTTQLDRGWINTNALSILDVADQRLSNTVLLDDVDSGAANPWGVACTADGKYICVSHAGSHEVSVIDRAKLHQKLARAAAGERVSDATSSAGDVPNDLSFLVGLRRRFKLEGNGPRGLTTAGTKVYTAEYFTDTIGVIDTDRPRPKARSLPLAEQLPLTTVRKGEMFFHDARLCFQKWQSCSSCHPGGRADGLNWDLLNDGMGNPKNTKSMFLSHKTPPAMITGVRENAESAVRAGIEHIQFAVRPEQDAVAIDKYLKSLRPVPSPHLLEGKLSSAAERGGKIFREAGCAKCHPSPLYTDMQRHNVGTGRDREKDIEFDTPTLVEVWRTAPFLYDGRAATMREALTRFNKNDKHGATSQLSEREIADLVEFVLSQ
ncbi:beta-propeller fold lactonase family protein [bacterium]|nr:beta-propeller fold lactonase family protein [bacterium]